MDHAAIAGTGGHAEFGILFDEEDVLPAMGEGFGDGAADDTAADDESVDLVHDVLGYDRQERRELMLSCSVRKRQGLAGNVTKKSLLVVRPQVAARALLRHRNRPSLMRTRRLPNSVWPVLCPPASRLSATGCSRLGVKCKW